MALPSLFEMCARLVAEPSVSCARGDHDQSNLGVVHRLAEWAEQIGLQVEIQPIDGAPGKANLIARSAGDPGAGLVLAGHTDTVPFDADRWQADPFTLRDVDGRWTGLGICDMKGFFPLALAAIEPLLHGAAGAARRGQITLLATADEESTMSGARHLLAKGAPRARYAVIGEPTDFLPVYAHKGMVMLAIRLVGRSGHSSNPALGANALDAMHAVMSELMVLRNELAARYRHPGFAVEIPTLNLGCLHAGDSPNRICGSAELQLDVRLMPGMDPAALVQQIDARLRPIADATATVMTIDHLFPALPAFATPPDAQLVAHCEAISGQRAGTVAFGTEGPYLQALGMETVVWGPGHIDQAHQPEEFLRCDRLAPTVAGLQQLISRCCG